MQWAISISDKMHIWDPTELYIQESEHLWNDNKGLVNFFPNLPYAHHYNLLLNTNHT